MDDTYLIALATTVAVGSALFVTRRRAASLATRLRAALEQAGGALTLPALVARVGLEDSPQNRGKVIQALAPMLRRGEVLEHDDPDATAKTGQAHRTFRLRA